MDKVLSQLTENMLLLHPPANDTDHLQYNKPCFASADMCSRVWDRTEFASATCWNRPAGITGTYSDTVQFKAVETMGKKKEKASKGKHLFSLPLATSSIFLIIEMLKLAEVAEWIALVII